MSIILPKPNEIFCGVYLIGNKITNKVYIGSSTNIFRRWNEHKTRMYNGHAEGSYIIRALVKYGIENFLFCVLEIVEPAKLAEVELGYIKLFDSAKIGYNLVGETFKNHFGRNHSEETKRLIGKKLSGQTRTLTQRNRISIGHIGNQSAKGAIRNNGWRKYQSLVQKGIKKPNSGAKRKPILQLNFKGEIIREWPSIAAAARGTQQFKTCIQLFLKGKVKTAGGFKWKLK